MSPSVGTCRTRAYDAVRRMIVEGVLEPGDRLNIRLLAERLGLSATPVKTALAALARDGFVTPHHGRGFVVTVLDDRDVEELFQLREALEPFAACRASARSGRDGLAQLRVLVTEQRGAAEADDRATYNELNLRFHRALWRLAGNERLSRVMDDVMGQMGLVTTFTSRAPGRLVRAIDDHAAMVDLCESGDVAALQALVAGHVRDSLDAYRQMVAFPW